MKIKLLVVDDSAFMRKIIQDVLEDIKEIEVVGIARNGLEALEKIKTLNPDIVTLDIEMPKLNGIDTLKIIKSDYNIPVIMLSSQSGIDNTILALELGAEDFIEKPKNLNENLDLFTNELEEKIKSVACIDKNCEFKKITKENKIKNNIKTDKKTSKRIDAVVIAASTGGPRALVSIIKNLDKDINIPVIIVQHMPKGFTKSFAQRLDGESKLKVVEASDNLKLEKNTVYIAPGDYHITIENGYIKTNQKDRIHGVRPAADYLFESAAREYKENLLAIILTGMGKDGARGMEYVKKYKGYNIAQSERTCVVYGMPSNAIERKVVDNILDLEDIAGFVNSMVKGL